MADPGAARPLQEALRSGADRLAAAGIDSARHDAEALAAHVLGVRRGELTAVTALRADDAQRYDELVVRRASRVPLQHLLGRVGFRRLDLAIGPGAFVPRPETEVVVQWALAALGAAGPGNPLVVDLCTGPGTIALALAHEAPAARVHAVERDPGALVWARRNARERAAAGDTPVTLHLGDITEALTELDGTVDLVLSNPPYVATGERNLVDPEVRDHDPQMALWAGTDGLDVIRLVESVAGRLLRPGGQVAVEHSDRQGASAPEVFLTSGNWTDVTDHPDLTGRDRFVTATRR
ncbi:MAG: peptide chain release factor N(5)-glutamine methyltransferase [Mycobacteriales bacterium]